MIKEILRKVAKAFRLFVLRDPVLIEGRRWFKCKGDETYRLGYTLDKNSIVFDVGGHRGDFANSITGKYHCQVYIFEPMPEFYAAICERFAENQSIRVFNFGLSNTNGTMDLFDSDDGSSFLSSKNAKRTVSAEMRNITEFLVEHGLKHIDLMKINIEGGEYELLPTLIDSGHIKCVKNLQIQFHSFIPNAVALRDMITSKLSETHHQTWCFRFIWENWTLKGQ